MAIWQPNGKVYLPPSAPVARILNTEEYIQRTNLFYHANTERLLTVGHPYYEIKDNLDPSKIGVPKVSANQYRVFRIKLPDPNRFALGDKSLYDPEKERLVWGVRGLEIERGQPLNVGSSGNVLYNKFKDTENPNNYAKEGEDERQNVSHDPKQMQMLLVGCKPATGEHWDAAKTCAERPPNKGDCPPLELVNSIIEDGDMIDIGYGNLNFKTLCGNKSDVPLDINTTTTKYPDFLKMTSDQYGDSLFFYTKRESTYARHFWTRGGTPGDPIPEELFVNPSDNQKILGSSTYFTVPSGSLVSSESQLFNRPYWLQKATGQNNGICWNNDLFITVVDNTRNCNFTISVFNKADSSQGQTYKSSNYNMFLRHVEEFELNFIFEICKVPLKADVLAHINAMDPRILEDWSLGFVPSNNFPLEDKYRFINSLATRCPDKETPKEKEDPYRSNTFWTVELEERMSSELDQYPLGRKFLFQSNISSINTVAKPRKRKATTPTTKTKRRK
ncbi:major capsid protein [Bandicoot papillomatosis carcinomatosis virus type 2]|uniref:Major capsid protein L1 n=1 Tax=Bandicoot papillomatosis carcinomatosis virus type 2 TaxID=500654 RepID=B3FN92_9PAPI|nr:major capsid protein [Bandicoot papillomatosis carcinomatosis virus type 2]ABZ89642.1 major capsid protein [Bandicoot papillomatosis carcinomatosis virus type 2]